MKKINVYVREWKSDYRHFICIAITLISLGAGFLFPNALPRLAETLYDLLISIGYYLLELILPDSNTIVPRVLEMPKWKFAESIW